MLYLVGLGLGDANDITLKGLEIVKKVGTVYLENYTSILTCGHEELEKLYGRTIELIDRETMEEGCDEILKKAKNDPNGAAVLVVGDPLNATTHSDFILRAVKSGIDYQIVHNASIINAVACCGLQIYNFGETVSIPFWHGTDKPKSFYEKIISNYSNGKHTLCLLDIQVKEPNLEFLARGIKKYEPPRFMTVAQAAKQLQEAIESYNQGVTSDWLKARNPTKCLALARIGTSTQKIVYTTILRATDLDLGPPLHSLVVPGKLHPLEAEMMACVSKSDF